MNFLSMKWWGLLYTVAVLMILYLMWTIQELRPESLTLLWLSTIIVIGIFIVNYYIIKKEMQDQEKMASRRRQMNDQTPFPSEKTFTEKTIGKRKKE